MSNLNSEIKIKDKIPDFFALYANILADWGKHLLCKPHSTDSSVANGKENILLLLGTKLLRFTMKTLHKVPRKTVCEKLKISNGTNRELQRK